MCRTLQKILPIYDIKTILKKKSLDFFIFNLRYKNGTLVLKKL